MKSENNNKKEEELISALDSLNKKIQIVKDGKVKRLLLRGQLYMSWEADDKITERIAIVQLYKSENATYEELSLAFGIHVNTVTKYINTFNKHGIARLIGEVRGPRKSWKITPEIRGKILWTVLKEGIKRYEEIQQRLKDCWNLEVSLGSIWQVLKENGFVVNKIEIPHEEDRELFDSDVQLKINFLRNKDANKKIILSQNNEKVKGNNNDAALNVKSKKISFYSNAQRIYLNQLEEGEYNTYGGGLLFIPLLEEYKFLDIIKSKVNIKTCNGYSLEQLCLTLFYFDIFGFHSIENFKTVYAEEFGLLINKLSGPGIKTLRRFLHKVRKLEKTEELIEEFGKEYIKKGLVKYGVLYIDSHFLPYYGMKEISFGWNTIRDRGMRGSYNFITNDKKFRPLIFLVRAGSEDLIEKIPEIISKVKKIGKEAGVDTKNLTVIFDREGYSAELFRLLTGEEVGIENKDEYKAKFISWAKYADKWVYDFEDKKFSQIVEVEYEIQEKEIIKYFETERQMSKYGKIRAIVIESGSDKKRSAIYTNDSESEAGIIIQLICNRWGQENLIKTLKLRHLIDYHPGYFSEELEEQPMVDNPVIEELKYERAKLQSKTNELKIKIADKILDENKEKKKEKIKKSEIEIKAEIAILNHQVFKINEKIEKLPKEIKYNEAHDGRKLFELDYEKKRFLDCIKVFAYHMEKKMCEILTKYYDRKKEILPALTMIVRRGAYIKLECGKLRVLLRGFKNPEIDYAARHLCDELNQMKPVTLDKLHLKIYYEVI